MSLDRDIRVRFQKLSANVRKVFADHMAMQLAALDQLVDDELIDQEYFKKSVLEVGATVREYKASSKG